MKQSSAGSSSIPHSAIEPPSANPKFQYVTPRKNYRFENSAVSGHWHFSLADEFDIFVGWQDIALIGNYPTAYNSASSSVENENGTGYRTISPFNLSTTANRVKISLFAKSLKSYRSGRPCIFTLGGMRILGKFKQFSKRILMFGLIADCGYGLQ